MSGRTAVLLLAATLQTGSVCGSNQSGLCCWPVRDLGREQRGLVDGGQL